MATEVEKEMNHHTEKSSRLKNIWKFIKKNPSGVLGIILVTISVSCALFAPWIAPKDPMESVLSDRLVPPSWLVEEEVSYILGTDQIGRDLLSRIIHGA